ncbi:MAG: hypothetical protein LBV43_02035 [Prevotella sp.]|nr:hypothetical protein [Prevotella sp.]
MISVTDIPESMFLIVTDMTGTQIKIGKPSKLSVSHDSVCQCLTVMVSAKFFFDKQSAQLEIQIHPADKVIGNKTC